MKHTRQFPLWRALILCASLLPHALAQASSPPPLKPNEKVITTKDGCGFVVDESKPSAKYEIDRITKLTWGGPCVGGLAMGEGWIFEGDYRYKDFPPRKGWLWYGRLIGNNEFRSGETTSFSFTWDGKGVSYNTLSTTGPVWTEIRGDFLRRSRVGDGVTFVTTSSRGCILEKKSFPECESENKFDIPGVMVMNLETKANQFHACPNPRSTQGCEVLWAQHAGPVIERIKAFIAENSPKVTAAKREVAPLIARWRPSPTAARDDAARHAAIRAQHLAEREQREAEQTRRKHAHEQRMKELDAQIAAQRTENERLNAIAAQERKERNRRDRQEAMGLLRSYSNTAASMGNNKPASRLSRVEALTQKPPEGENRVSTALNAYANRQNRKYPDSPPSPPAANPTPTGSPTPPNSSSSGGSGSSREFPVAALTHCVKASFLPSSLGRRYYQLANVCSVEIICSASTFIDGKKRHYDGMGCGYGLAPGHRVKHPYGITASGSLSTQVDWACPSKAVVEQQLGKKISGIGWRDGRGCVGMLKHQPVGTGR